MLYRTGNSHRNIEIGSHYLPCLADLHVVGCVAAVDRSARCTDSGTQFIGKLFEKAKIFCAAETASARDDDLGGCKIRSTALRHILAEECCFAWQGIEFKRDYRCRF